MNNKSSAPYSTQIAYLPADSNLPSSLTGVDRDVLYRVLPLCREVIEKAETFENDMWSAIPRSLEVSNKLDSLNGSILDVFHNLESELITSVQATSFETSDLAIRSVLANEPDDIFKGYSIYDRYFHVIRIAGPSMLQILGQVAKTSHMIINDLEYAMLSRDEFTFIINNIKTMFQYIVSNASEQASNDIVFSGALDRKTDWQQEPEKAWEDNGESPTEWTHKVARYRWITGHHLFNLCSIFCINYLNRAREQFEKGIEVEGNELLRQAGFFLRGTTASMWYAASMPGNIYLKYVRPSMISQESPNGFSGDQNAEYKRLKVSKALLENTLLRLYGAKRTQWPKYVKEAVNEFVEFDTRDCEAHTLIAAAMAGMDTSISQKQWQQNLPPDFEHLNAVDLLREITVQRRQSFAGQI